MCTQYSCFSRRYVLWPDVFLGEGRWESSPHASERQRKRLFTEFKVPTISRSLCRPCHKFPFPKQSHIETSCCIYQGLSALKSPFLFWRLHILENHLCEYQNALLVVGNLLASCPRHLQAALPFPMAQWPSEKGCLLHTPVSPQNPREAKEHIFSP